MALTPEQQAMVDAVQAKLDAEKQKTTKKAYTGPVSKMDIANDWLSGINSTVIPSLRLLSRAEQATTGTEHIKGLLDRNQESVERGATVRQNWPGWLQSGGHRVGDTVGEIAGAVALTKGQGLAPTLGGRMVQGTANAIALAPSVAPLEEDTLSAMNQGAKWGMITGGALEGVRKGAEVGGPPLRQIFSSSKTKAAHMLRNLLGDQKPAVVDALRNTRSRVPGEKLTAGEAAVPARNPQMSTLQKMVDEDAVKKFQEIDSANRAARLANIEKQGGNVRVMEANRNAATAPLREAALSSARPLKAKDVVQVIDDALTDKVMPKIQRKVLEEIKANVLSRTDDGFISPDALYTVRKEIGLTKEFFTKEGVEWNKAMAGRMQGKIQKIFDDLIEGAGGKGWKKYLRTYREKSIPIENAQRANVLADKLQDPLGKETPGQFFKAASRNPKTIPNNQNLQVAVDETMESLQRRADLQKMAMKGKDATRNAMNVPHLPNTGMFSPSYQVTKSILNRFSDRATKGVMKEIAASFDDPAEVLKLLAKTDIPGPWQETIIALSKQAKVASAIALERQFSGVHPH